jgi:phosphoglycolate phosphatase-like HAD superfamily hydrolase
MNSKNNTTEKGKLVPVYLYDLSDTLVRYEGQKEFFKSKGIEWAEQQYGEPEATEVYAKAIIDGLRKGTITLKVLEGIKEALARNQKDGVLNVVYSGGRNDEIQAVLEAAKLLQYVTSWFSTFALGSGKFKTETAFLFLYEQLLKDGKEIKVYFDDNKISTTEAQKAVKRIEAKYGNKIRICLIDSNARDQRTLKN